MLMRLNLDKVQHPIHCYYPASGKVFFDRLRFCSIYHEVIKVVEHPVEREGVVVDDEHFRIEAFFLEHGIDNIGWRIKEPDTHKFEKDKLALFGVQGPLVRQIEKEGQVVVGGKTVMLSDVSHIRTGDVVAVAIDTLPSSKLTALAKDARVFLCESTYLERHKDLAKKHYHLTAKQAAEAAKKAGAKELILTHFSARYQDLREFEEEARAIFPNTQVAEDLKQFTFPK